jgi:phenylacetate-coenzyme A ligase PaaK-like adenylate-forming protein
MSAFDPWRATAIAADVLLVSRAAPAALAQRQSRRLAVLLEAARRGSPLYRERLRDAASFHDVPPVGKRELMERFDDWVCEPRLRLDALRDFVADPSRIGQAFGGEFVVWESSGSSGEPALFVQDAKAMAIYDALEAWRRPRRWQRWLDPWYVGERVAFIGATGGHFASTVSIERLRRLQPALAASLRSFSFLQPLKELVEQLNRDRPTIVATYPTAALLLAEEAAAGRLDIAPREVWTGGETLTAAMRRVVERQFACPVSNSYGASEFLTLATECRFGALHLNSDWVMLEPVDEQLRPLPPGEPAWSTLLTNLANHVQPLIRYDLGDRVRVHAGRCACGSSLPVIDVEGRCDDMLVLRDPGGDAVRLVPLALTTVLEDDAGVFDFQLVQCAADTVRLTVGGEQGRAELKRARGALTAFLRSQGLKQVRIEGRVAPATIPARSGKVQRVVAATERVG